MSMEEVATKDTVAAAELRQLIERLEEEKTTLQDDIKEVMAEAKGRGFLSPLKLVA
jgi:uncharacterized protein (UPF0335 family)